MSKKFNFFLYKIKTMSNYDIYKYISEYATTTLSMTIID